MFNSVHLCLRQPHTLGCQKQKHYIQAPTQSAGAQHVQGNKDFKLVRQDTEQHILRTMVAHRGRLRCQSLGKEGGNLCRTVLFGRLLTLAKGLFQGFVPRLEQHAVFNLTVLSDFHRSYGDVHSAMFKCHL